MEAQNTLEGNTRPHRLRVLDELYTLGDELANVYGRGGLIDDACNQLDDSESSAAARVRALEAVAKALHQATRDVLTLAKQMK